VVPDGGELVSFTLQPLNPPHQKGGFCIDCGLNPSLGVVLQVKIPYLWNQALVIQLFRLQELMSCRLMFITIVLSYFDLATVQDIIAIMFYTIYHRSAIQVMLIILYESKNYEFDDAQRLLSFWDVMPCSLIEIYKLSGGICCLHL
jgi:hypothetical protein